MRTMRQTLGLGVTIAALLVAAPTPAAAQDNSADVASSVQYELFDRSTYQSGCLPPCNCPMMDEAPLRGTFDLVALASTTPGARTYKVANVRWAVARPDGTTLAIGGCGAYSIVVGSAAMLHRLELDLKVDGNPVQHFDSGLVPGGNEFPGIDIKVSMNGGTCYDTLIHVIARPAAPPPLPRHACFLLRPDSSSVELSLFAGGARSKLTGTLRLFLGDPSVPVIATVVGMVGLSVEGADLVAPDFEPTLPGIPEPLHMMLDPRMKSIGTWHIPSGAIQFDLHLIASNNGNMPVPMPLHVHGTLANGGLEVSGDNGNVADAKMTVKISAVEVAPPPPPPPPIDLWFSTEIGFGAMSIWPPQNALVHVSDGDLLSWRGFIVRKNHQLTGRLGIMPIVPDLGLDAVVRGPRGTIWFSFEEKNSPIWSETLGVWLKHGDLLSDAGFVVQSNERLLERFVRMPPVADAGLDAIDTAPNAAFLFSTEVSFFSEALGRLVKHGDLLSNRGQIVRTNEQLLANFSPADPWMGPQPRDYGLDAIIMRPNKEIWFSTEIGFLDANLGPISDGDLLSTNGSIVMRNLKLVEPFGPVEDVANFGLDAATLIVRPTCRFDFDLDGDVDLADFIHFQASFNGPNRTARVATPDAVSEFDADGDGDGDADLSDFTAFAACFNGPNRLPKCE